MLRCVPALVLVFGIWAGCGGSSDSNKTAAETAQAQARPTTGLAALSGTWNGVTEVPVYGTIMGVFNISSDGRGTYLVTISGVQRSGSLRLISWDDEWLRGSAEGREERVRALLFGQRLRLELPQVGTVNLYRED